MITRMSERMRMVEVFRQEMYNRLSVVDVSPTFYFSATLKAVSDVDLCQMILIFGCDVFPPLTMLVV